jgi:hypothetical protein
MTLLQTIGSFVIRRAPRPICDHCIADHLALEPRQASAAGQRLKLDRSFDRFTGKCSGCCTWRKVTVLAKSLPSSLENQAVF